MANNNHNNNHNNNSRKGQGSQHNNYPRFRNNRNRHRDNYEGRDDREDVEVRENREHRERREYRENKEYRERREYRENKEKRENKENHDNRNSRDNQAISTFVLGTKELEGKNAEFHYDKGWYSIIDVLGEEKNVIYKSKNAQEAYTKWNVYIGRKKERLPKIEKTE